MNELQIKLPIDTWIDCTWKEFSQLIQAPEYEKAKCYYDNGQLRIEMPPVGSDHSRDNGIVVTLVNQFAIAKNIPLNLLINCSYQKPGEKEIQPDVSYYLGERAKLAPTGSSVANLDNVALPDLVIEIANTSLADDLGQKRLIYEDLAIAEYWVVDVNKARVTAFKIVPSGGSQRISKSVVLPNLKFALLEEGLQRSRQTDHTSVAAWFLTYI
ncbi:Uma2 family endonuclease [Synechocystis sp. PCC 7509]|uniref:Uma2 family endonuclease n=1 Tax=Synechocystis sp. PCC 7509 TaxID=927677 RepID=UPI0002ACEFFB|nr:Uma2 family endonuclease [Synechocystis sp. PCC 7509]